MLSSRPKDHGVVQRLCSRKPLTSAGRHNVLNLLNLLDIPGKKPSRAQAAQCTRFSCYSNSDPKGCAGCAGCARQHWERTKPEHNLLRQVVQVVSAGSLALPLRAPAPTRSLGQLRAALPLFNPKVTHRQAVRRSWVITHRLRAHDFTLRTEVPHGR